LFFVGTEPAKNACMSQDLWTAVDQFLGTLFVEEDEALRAALTASQAAGLPEIQVTANAGKMLHVLSRVMNARRILEIGTLGGYSSIWMGRALAGREGAKLVSLEVDPRHAEVARGNLARAGLDVVVEVRVGAALATLPTLLEQLPRNGPFDLFFIDADKENNADYFGWSLRLARPGSLIVVDNVIRKGEILNAASADTSVQGTRRLLDAIAAAQRDGRVSATAIQTVGGKGYDGWAVAIVN
jgi:predicted O-methyltransferase YrrM